MQKIAFVFCPWIVGVLLVGTPVFAAVDPAMAANIRKLAASAVSAEYQGQMQEKNAAFLKDASSQLENFVLRMNTMESSLLYFNRIKKRMFATSMIKYQEEVARACCPLKSARILDNKRWFFLGRGRGSKLKALTGQRKSEPRKGQGKKSNVRKAQSKSKTNI